MTPLDCLVILFCPAPLVVLAMVAWGMACWATLEWIAAESSTEDLS